MANLTMMVQRLGMDDSVPSERRGCMVARIELNDDLRGNFIELLGTRDGFDPAAVAQMLRTMAETIQIKMVS